jgi:hypothetical protein
MAAVVVYPFRKLSIVLAPRKEAATKGVEGAIDRKPAMVAAFAPNRVVFTRCLPGRTRGLLDNLPASLRNATMDPVKVIPPSSNFDG